MPFCEIFSFVIIFNANKSDELFLSYTKYTSPNWPLPNWYFIVYCYSILLLSSDASDLPSEYYSISVPYDYLSSLLG